MVRKTLYSLLLLLILVVPVNVFAAGSVSVSSQTVTVEVGSTKSFDVVVDNAVGFADIKSNDVSIATVDKDYLETGMGLVGKSEEFPISVTGKKVGTTTVVIDVYDMTSYDSEVLNKKINVTINVVEKEVQSTTYTVTFDTKGGTPSQSAKTVAKGGAITLPSVSKSGFEFLGWSTSTSESGIIGRDGASWVPTSNVTLTAIWKTEKNGYISVSSQTVTVEVGSTKSFDVVVYNAIGFADIKSNDVSIATVDKDYLETGMGLVGKSEEFPITVTGKKVGTTTVVIDVYDMTSYDSEVLNKKINVTINVVEKEVQNSVCDGSVDDPTNVNKVWTSDSCINDFTPGKLHYWSSDDNCCLVRDKYYVSYVYNGGTKGANNPSEGVVGYGSNFDQFPSKIVGREDWDYLYISNPTKTITITGNKNGTNAGIGSASEGTQRFLGWTLSGGNSSTALYGTSSSSINTAWSNANTKVKAQYFRNLTTKSGDTVKLTANWEELNMKVPTLTNAIGYTCNWNTKADGTGDSYASGGTYKVSSTSQSAITLYVDCEPNGYKVRYDGNDSTSGSMNDSIHVYGTAKTLTKNTYVRTGFVFIGWNTKADGTGDSYADGASIRNLISTNGGVVTLYAQWSSNGSELKTATLTIEEDAATLKVDEIKSFVFAYTGDSVNSEISCQSSSNSIAICVIEGNKLKITAVSEGSATITLTAKATSTYKSAQDSMSISVYNSSEGGNGNSGSGEEGNLGEGDNPTTGNIAIAFVLFFGLFALGYAVYYFKKIKQN